MAKAGETGIVDKHVEKGVLVVSVLLLLWVVYAYVLQSPREFVPPPRLGSEAWVPEQIDQKLQSEAKRLVRRNKIAEVPKTEFYNPQLAMRQLRAAPLGLPDNPLYPRIELADGNRPLAIPVPPKIGEGGIPDYAKLLDRVPRPRVPKVSLLREMADRDDPADYVAHGAFQYPWGELRSAWNEVLAQTIVENRVIALSVEVEVQQRPTGSDTWSPSSMPELTAQPLQAGGQPFLIPRDIPKIPPLPAEVPKTDEDKLKLGQAYARSMEFVNALAQHYPRHVLEPEYYAIYWAGSNEYTPWTIHLPKDVIPSFDSTLPDATTPGGTPGGPTIPGAGPVIPGSSRGRGSGRMPMPTIPRGRGRSSLDGPDWVAPPPREDTGAEARRRQLEERQRRAAEERKRRADEARRRAAAAAAGARGRGRGAGVLDERMMGPDMPGGPGMVRPGSRIPPTRRPTRPLPPKPEETELQFPPDPPEIPELAVQMQRGTVLGWFHQEKGLEPRHEYRYRVRMQFYNPLFGEFANVKEENRADCLKTSIPTPWSDWSDPVHLPRATEFFLAGAMRQSNYVNVQVYAYAYGLRVSEQFKVYEGQPIGGKKKIRVPNPALRRPAPATAGRRGAADAAPLPPATVMKEVDFSTGAVAVEFNFERSFPKPSLPNNTTLEMLYMGDMGTLESRLLDLDKSSKKRKDLEMEIRRAKALAAGV